MNKSRRRYNWKSRQVVETEIDETATKKIKVDLEDVKSEQYDASNALVLPSKKRATRVKSQATTGAAPSKPLSRKQRKRLQKILASKVKKQSRAKLFEALAEVQAKPEDMSLFVATAQMQTKGFKRHAMEWVEEMASLKSVRGSNKRSNVDGMKAVPEEETSSEDSEESGDEGQIPEFNGGEAEGDSGANPVATEEDAPSVDDISADPGVILVQTQKAQEVSQSTEEVVTRPTVFRPVDRAPEIQEARLKLPILAEEQVIMEAINGNPIVILSGETGSGKTTQVPQFLYEAGYTSDEQLIAVTEPRRVAAITMSRRVAEEMGVSTDRVSYQIRYEGNVTDDTEIKFMTDGVLLKEIQKDFLLSRYSVVIVDEAHERSVFTDILLGLLSRIVPLRNKRKKPLKLVIMSATLRVEDFTENRHLFKTVPPVVKVESRQYPVTVHFNKKTADDYLADAYRKVCKIHRQLPSGGILIFLTGQQEVNVLCNKLRRTFPLEQGQKWTRKCKHGVRTPSGTDTSSTNASGASKGEDVEQQLEESILPKISLDDYAVTPGDEDDAAQEADDGSEIGDLQSDDDDEDGPTEKGGKLFRSAPEQPMYVLPLYSLLPPNKQALVFQPPPEGCRLCVVATNVAETSVTIPNVKYVVDCGKVKTRVYDRVTGVSAFQVSWTSKAAANQRAGRAGRTGSGHCYRLYSSAVFNDDFVKFARPEICRRPVDDLVLQLKDMNIDRVLNFPFPTPIDEESIKASERRLTMLGALEQSRPLQKSLNPTKQFCSKISKLGHAMACFPLAPRYGKMLALSHQHNLLPYVICIVSALTVQEVLCERNIVVHSEQEKSEIKGKRAQWMQIRKMWAGQGNSLALGDIAVLLKAVGAAEYAGCTRRFCEEHGLRYKAIAEIRKLRIQLTNAVNLILPSVDLCVDPKMLPPGDLQAKQLRQILLAGLPDNIARKVLETEIKGDHDEKIKWKRAYKVTHIEEPVFIHPNSVLFHELPDYVVYQEIFETNKMFMRGVTAIEPEWLVNFCQSQCTFSKPLEEPGPRYDPSTGTVRCHMTSSFGRCAWQLPAAELEYPEGIERIRWFARFLLEGQVCPKLARFKDKLLTPPITMIKTWSRLQPRTETLLKGLLSENVDSRERLFKVWETNKHYLLQQYMEWVPASEHFSLENLWPPL